MLSIGHRRLLAFAVLAFIVLLVRCGGAPQTSPDGGSTAVDSGAPDAGAAGDAGLADAGSTDAGGSDAGSTDAGGSDAGTDGGNADAGALDAGHCSPRPPGAPANDAWRRQRTTVDQPDDEQGAYQVHVLYVEPADRSASPQLDVDGSIRRSMAAINDWFAAKMGGARLRFDTCEGTLDVTHVKLDAGYTEVAMAAGTVGSPAGPVYHRDRLENLLKVSFAEPNKLYLVYVDGLDFGHCGGAPLPPALRGRFTALFVGGIFRATFLTAVASAGQTQLTVHSTAQLPLPATPFTAQVGTEQVTVTQVAATSLTLQQALTSAHSAGTVVRGSTTIPDCRANPFSPDGHQLDYWEFSAGHEVLHALGIVPADAPDHAPSPVAAGHLADTGAAGRADIMYQGNLSWTCQTFPPATGPSGTPCALDPGHRNYFQTDGGTTVDLARSVFLSPTPSAAQQPPAW